jgi:hypothetical protein
MRIKLDRKDKKPFDLIVKQMGFNSIVAPKINRIEFDIIDGKPTGLTKRPAATQKCAPKKKVKKPATKKVAKRR